MDSIWNLWNYVECVESTWNLWGSVKYTNLGSKFYPLLVLQSYLMMVEIQHVCASDHVINVHFSFTTMTALLPVSCFIDAGIL